MDTTAAMASQAVARLLHSVTAATRTGTTSPTGTFNVLLHHIAVMAAQAVTRSHLVTSTALLLPLITVTTPAGTTTQTEICTALLHHTTTATSPPVATSILVIFTAANHFTGDQTVTESSKLLSALCMMSNPC